MNHRGNHNRESQAFRLVRRHDLNGTLSSTDTNAPLVTSTVPRFKECRQSRSSLTAHFVSQFQQSLGIGWMTFAPTQCFKTMANKSHQRLCTSFLQFQFRDQFLEQSPRVNHTTFTFLTIRRDKAFDLMMFPQPLRFIRLRMQRSETLKKVNDVHLVEGLQNASKQCDHPTRCRVSTQVQTF